MSLDLSVMERRDRRILIQHEKKMRGKPFLVSAYPGIGGLITQQHLFLTKINQKLDYSHDYDKIYSTSLVLSEV